MACSYCSSSYRSFLVCVILQMSLYLQVIIKMTLFCKSWCVPWHLVGAKLLLLFSTWKKEKCCILHLTLFHWKTVRAKNWTCPSLKWEEAAEKRGQGKRGEAEEREGGGLSHGAHGGETISDRPAASPHTEALILPQTRIDFKLKLDPPRRHFRVEGSQHLGENWRSQRCQRTRIFRLFHCRLEKVQLN